MTVDPFAGRALRRALRLALRLAQRLRQLRKRAGLSVRHAAHRAGITRESLYRIEAGKAFPAMGSICRLADALEVEPSELLCVLDSRWAMTEAWRADPLEDGCMAEVATPRRPA